MQDCVRYGFDWMINAYSIFSYIKSHIQVDQTKKCDQSIDFCLGGRIWSGIKFGLDQKYIIFMWSFYILEVPLGLAIVY